jgi:UDP-N-acetylmuramate: L-alanyl-gamma-D-glutamyl-meso-diaminopimelate ligase
MRRRVFENELADALASADGAVLGAVNRAQLLSDDERLSPDRVLARIRAAGRRAEAFASADAIAEFLAAETRPGDVVLALSNGSFDGLCEKLLARLNTAVPARDQGR